LLLGLCTKNTSWALIERPYSCAPQAVGAVYDRPGFFVQSLLLAALPKKSGKVHRISGTHSPPKLGGDASEASGEVPFWNHPGPSIEASPCLARASRGDPPNLGGALHKKSCAVIDRPYSLGCVTEGPGWVQKGTRSEEHTSEQQSRL